MTNPILLLNEACIVQVKYPLTQQTVSNVTKLTKFINNSISMINTHPEWEQVERRETDILIQFPATETNSLMFETKSDEHVLADDNICISGVIYFHLEA